MSRLAVPLLSRQHCAVLSFIVLGVTVAGCELGPGQFSVDPGRYEFYHCNDLVTQLQALEKRESELRSLMTKASEGGGGAVIGELSYRGEYETVLSQEKLLKRVAAEKKCEIAPPTFQSDQAVR